MRLTIPDDLADRYLEALPTAGAAHAQRAPDAGPPHTLEALLVRVLERAVPLAHPASLVLTAAATEQLIAALLLPDGARDPALLIDAARDLADLKIGKFRLKLSAPVLRGLKDRAEREGKPMEEFVQRIVDQLTEEVATYA